MAKCNQELWTSIKADIESKIISGEYKVGEKIPTLIELVKIYDIGKTTAQRVINALSDEGSIVKRVHAGCFVLPGVPEKLFEKRKNIVQHQLRTLVELADSWGIDNAELLELLSDEIKSV